MKLVIATTFIAATAAFSASAQYYGAGSTMNQTPGAHYQRMQEQQRWQAQQYYIRQAPPPRMPDPNEANAWNPLAGCVGGAYAGARVGGGPGVVYGCGAGAVGLSRLQIIRRAFTVPNAY